MDSSVRQSEKFHFFCISLCMRLFLYVALLVFSLLLLFFFFITTYCISVCSRALICTQCVRAHKNAALSRHESGGGGVLSLLWMCKKKKTEKRKGQQRKAICLLHLRAKNFLFFVSFLLKEKKETLKKGDVMSS